MGVCHGIDLLPIVEPIKTIMGVVAFMTMLLFPVGITVYKSENIDIHHIFPRSYCEKNNLSKEKWNSVVNKTPISYSTNREIGGVAPSEYLKKIEEKGQVNYNSLNDYLQTHLIDVSAARSNDFEKHIVLRAKLLLDAIEKATGKIISGKDSDEVISKFGERLIF